MKANQLRQGLIGISAVLFLMWCSNPASATLIYTSNGDLSDSAVGWLGYHDSGSSVDGTPTVVDRTPAGKAIKFNYDFSGGNWVLFASPVFGNLINLSAFNALAFNLKSDHIPNTLTMEITDISDHLYKSGPIYLTATASDWSTVIIPFTNFGSSFDSAAQQNIKKIGFTIDPVEGGSGYVSLDNLSVLVLTATPTPTTTGTPTPTPTTIVVNSCEGDIVSGGFTNDLSSIGGVLLPATLSRVSSPAPHGGTYSRQISGSGGSYEFVYRNNSPSQPTDASLHNFLSFWVRVPTALTSTFRCELRDLTPTSFAVSIPTYAVGGGLVVNTWTQIKIPLTAFTGVNSGNLGTLTFLTDGAADTVYIDDISFIYEAPTGTPTATPTPVIIDNMNTIYTNSSWEKNNASDTTLELASVAGFSGLTYDYALRMNYRFPAVFTSKYINVYRGFGLNVLEGDSNAFRFDYNGVGEKNKLEFKVTDNASVTYWMVFDGISDTDGMWKTINIPFTSMTEFGSTGKTFNFRSISKIEWALSKGATGSGGKGTFSLDNIGYVKQDDFVKPLSDQDLISSFKIDNNPFQPQTDPLHSKATFTFTLTGEAKVWLRIYTLNGKLVKTFEPATIPPLPAFWFYTASWDGLDDKEKLVRNGLYIYQFVAEGAERTQRIKNIIGVAR